MDITYAELTSAGPIVEMWLSLASGQREHDSHLLASENRARIRESIVRHIVTDRLLVARDDEILGFVMFALESGNYEQDVRRGLIENLYVVPDRRSEGIGSGLLAAAEGELRSLDVDVIALEVMATNDEARRFYRTHGYSPHRVELEKRIDATGSNRD